MGSETLWYTLPPRISEVVGMWSVTNGEVRWYSTFHPQGRITTSMGHSMIAQAAHEGRLRALPEAEAAAIREGWTKGGEHG